MATSVSLSKSVRLNHTFFYWILVVLCCFVLIVTYQGVFWAVCNTEHCCSQACWLQMLVPAFLLCPRICMCRSDLLYAFQCYMTCHVSPRHLLVTCISCGLVILHNVIDMYQDVDMREHLFWPYNCSVHLQLDFVGYRRGARYDASLPAPRPGICS